MSFIRRIATRTPFAIAAATLLSLGLAACGDDDAESGNGPYTLTFHGEGYDVHMGQLLQVAVVDVAADQIVATDEVTVSGDTISFTWPGLLVRDKAYRIDFWADLSGNGECDAPTADHGWSVPVDGSQADRDVQVDHNMNFVDVCDTFETGPPKHDVTFSGTGFEPHDTQTLYAALVRQDNDEVVESDEVVISGSTFTISWLQAAEEGKAYRLDFYADVDGNESCGDPDHIWRDTIDAVMGDVTVTYPHGTDFEPMACGSF